MENMKKSCSGSYSGAALRCEFAGLIYARVGPFPVSLCSLSVLMMDRRCMCAHTHDAHTHTQWNLPPLCFHLHLFSPVFLHVAVCVRKMGRCTHSLSELSVCCVRQARVGDVFSRGREKQSYEGSFPSALNYLLSLTTFHLWTFCTL